MKDVKGKDDEGNLNPLYVYERTPQTKSMTKGFQRGKKIYASGGEIDGQTFRSAVIWAKGDIHENFDYEETDLDIQTNLLSDHTELYKASNTFGIRDYDTWREIYEIAFEDMGIENPPQFAKGGMTKSMEVDEVMQDHFAKGGGVHFLPIKNKTTNEEIEGSIKYNDFQNHYDASIDGESTYFKDLGDAYDFMRGAGFKESSHRIMMQSNPREFDKGGNVGKNITYSATFDLMDADGNNIDNPMPSLQFDVSSDVSYGDAKGIAQKTYEGGNLFEEGMKAVMTDFWMGEMDADEEDRKRVEIREQEEQEEFVPKVERSGKWDSSYSVLCDELATYEQGGDVKDFSYEEDILPILKESIDDGVDEIDDYENVGDAQGEEIEYKGRSGFIPFTDGGYEKKWFEYISILNGSGTSLPTKVLDDEMERQVGNAYEYAKERFIEDNEELVEEIGEDKVNYSDLYELDMGDKAEELSEMEMDMGDDSIMMSVKAFYYNPSNSRAENNQHTITLIGDVNLEAPYHRIWMIIKR